MIASPAMMTQMRFQPVSPMQTAYYGGGSAFGNTQLGAAQNPGAAGGSKINQVFGAMNQKWTASQPQLPYFEEDRARLGGLLNGQSPFAGAEWGGLISQLQQQASGQGPSLAEQTYRGAAMDTTNSLSSMARGSGSPAAARAAMIERGRVGQGMQAGVATARTQEQLGAQGALAGALSSRDQLNQGAYLDILAAQLGLSRSQLEALTGNADRQANKDVANKQAKAAKWGAIAGGLGGLAML